MARLVIAPLFFYLVLLLVYPHVVTYLLQCEGWKKGEKYKDKKLYLGYVTVSGRTFQLIQPQSLVRV